MISGFSLRLRLFTIWVCILCLGGCSGTTSTINPGTGNVDIKVWVVLGQDDFFGDRGNDGCRLNAQEIRDRIQSLQNNAIVFGPNATFNWDDQFNIVIDTDLPFVGRTQSSSFWVSPVYNLWQQGRWDSQKINIYFVGNVQPTGKTARSFAATVEPFQGAFSEIPAFIFINDGGFDEINGFHPDFPPPVGLNRRTIEHEMAHYLSRFAGRTFDSGGKNPRTYDPNTEHAALGSNNLLAQPPIPILNFPEFQYRLRIPPGDVDSPGTEMFEIWQRILAGTWNQP